ncbi:MAG: DUF3800 domain-containing protein [Endomicrobium sp.]|jgi:hypothetical protein|uniref:DUF3800 domain-containing protein n=1 Tax=Candidatus Endomicrobiellum cubanum TaxID=3242325 RepID=UPI002822FCF0|nr:DUF3800 domain-containing protein [Endomicrobium sp.]
MADSKYLIFIDESGDHILDFTNQQYSVFVLACCIIKKGEYLHNLLPKFTDIKLKYFHNDGIIFHEREIHKKINEFSLLKNRDIFNNFMTDLNNLIIGIDYTLVATVINKPAIKIKAERLPHAYHFANKLCIERIQEFLKENNASNDMTTLLFEKRGEQEDKELKVNFYDLMREMNWNNLNIEIAPKATNSLGLQFVDLMARPIGRYAINPNQPNRAFEILKNKFRKQDGKFEDCGLKIYP